jgi:RNA polymerase sigma-70 factor (ECF subfamily)
VQDAFLSAYKGIGNFEKRSRFSTWLYTIVINTSRNRLRQIRSAVSHEHFSLDDTLATDRGSIRVELASDCPSAVEQLEKKELQAKVQGCIKQGSSERYGI